MGILGILPNGFYKHNNWTILLIRIALTLHQFSTYKDCSHNEMILIHWNA